MKHVIEVEEKVKIRHQIIVEIETDEDIDAALEAVDENCESLDDFVSAISSVIPVQEVNEEYYSETESVEYWDDYQEMKENG